jgi:hypothetical protein
MIPEYSAGDPPPFKGQIYYIFQLPMISIFSGPIFEDANQIKNTYANHLRRRNGGPFQG